MDTWQYLKRFGKPITKKQFEFRKITTDTAKNAGVKYISDTEYENSFGYIYKNKLKLAKKAGNIYKKVPWILSVVVTGSVASGYPDTNDDIDLMFICKKNTLWLSRICVYIVSSLNRLTIRRGSRQIKDELCLNLWLEEKYQLPADKQNLANAMDAILAVAMCGDQYYLDFLAKNKWIGTHVKSYILKTKDFKLKMVENEVGILTILLNKLSFYVSYMYMKRKGAEKVGYDHAFFHP